MVVGNMLKDRISRCFEKSRGIIQNCLCQGNELRLRQTAFTRERKLTALHILRVILKRVYKSLQLSLDDYFDELDMPSVSKQAFSKARQNLNPEFVREFCDMQGELCAEDDTFVSYRGMRLIAIDGSDLALENSKELKEAFGCSGPKKNAATALCSIAFAPFEQVIYDCRIDSYAKDERDLAKLHIGRLIELGLGGSLLLFDRWYPSAEFIACLYDAGFPFVMRVREKWNLAADDTKTQRWITLTRGDKAYPVRVLKIKLSTGETETLLTTLNQKQLPISQAGDLYFKRWAVETAYDMLKSKLQLENFSGKTKVSVLQDFYATVYLANLASFIACQADEEITQLDREKHLKHPRRANRNRAIDKLRRHFIRMIIEPEQSVRDAILNQIVTALTEKPVSVVSGRSPSRKTPRKKRYHTARKSVV